MNPNKFGTPLPQGRYPKYQNQCDGLVGSNKEVEMAGEKILVVEDEPGVLASCKRLLAYKGYRVEGAGNGYQAIERAKDEPSDLLLVDIRMPGMNGLETYQAIKEFNPDIIGVIITAYASLETAIEAIRLGFDGFLIKPFSPDELYVVVAKALERQNLRRENARLMALIPLFEMSNAFITTMDLGELLNQVVHVVKRETKTDRVSLMLLDEATGELTIEAAVGLPQEAMATTRTRLGEGIAGSVAKRGEPLLLDDKAPLDPRIREAMKSDVITSALCVPLKIKDRVIGVLNLGKLGGTSLTEGDLELASVLCGQAAIAIENARLFADLEQAKAELERWSQELELKVEERTKELREAHERLLRAERLAAIGQLGASVCHELGNPLGVINNSVYYLDTMLKDADGRVKKHLEIMNREIARAKKITRGLLSLTEGKEPTLQKTRINTIVQDALSHTPVPDTVAVITELGEDLPPLMADPDQIEQVFISVILNAIQAMPDGGKLEIATGAEDGFIVAEFKDNGCGIPEENLEKVFMPLFSTKVRGIGLGLSVSKNTIEAHSGRIEVESEIGKGSTFTVRLPMGGGEEE
jgi:signal transduction histidine kinase/DNA-binding response OmpR family regulator